MTKTLKSISDDHLINEHGRDARDGFIYQDHVGVKILIESLNQDNVLEVWFERFDDIEIITLEDSKKIIEFVQVKNQDLQSRYSISELVRRDRSSNNERVGTSLLEKSLHQAKFIEKSFFRLVTSTPVNNELKYLTYSHSNGSRNPRTSARKELLKKIEEKLPNLSSENGTNLNDWVDRCNWVVLPSKITDLKSSNEAELGSLIKEKFNTSLLFDHLQELYQKILVKVKNASTLDISMHPNKNVVTFNELNVLISEYIESTLRPKRLTDGLNRKFNDAKINDDYKDSAFELLLQYKEAKYDVDYINTSALRELEFEITSKLFELKILLDGGSVTPGLQFLKYCTNEVKKIASKTVYKRQGLSEHHGIGFMYKLTNSCPHRFHSVT